MIFLTFYIAQRIFIFQWVGGLTDDKKIPSVPIHPQSLPGDSWKHSLGEDVNLAFSSQETSIPYHSALFVVWKPIPKSGTSSQGL